MSASLSIRRLTRRYPATEAAAVEDLDLDVPAGACVALLGPTGSGKSTVLRLVAGLDTPDGGDVLLDGRSLRGVPTHARRTVLVFQRPRLFPHLDILDNVAFPLQVAGARRRQARLEAARLLDLVGLSALARRRPGSLSGGQEQRVALARALAARADVLLLDEPFSALDPAVRAEMHALLGQLRAAVEPTILLVTHDRHEAAVVADSVAVLLRRRVAQHDEVTRLYARPDSLEVHEFLGGRNAVAGTVARGVHHSALGSLALPPSTDATDGPGVLVVRQEALRLTSPRDAIADTTGTVVAVATHGPRSLVEVDTVAGPLAVEVGGWDAPQVGDVVGVALAFARRHVVPAPAGTPVSTGPASPPRKASRAAAAPTSAAGAADAGQR